MQPKAGRDLARVVILSRDEYFCADLVAEIATVRVASPYEAAAELLSGPTLAVIIDLRALSPKHSRLVEIAQQLGAEVIGCGKLSPALAASPIAGLRLLDVPSLPSHIHRLLEQENILSQLDFPQPADIPDVPPPQAAPSPERQPAPAAPAPHSPAQPEPPTLASPNLLTPQEIAALLGVKP